MSPISPCAPPAEHLLVDGALAILRPLLPDEPERVLEVFDALSDTSRYRRFHAATPRLTRTALRHLATVRPCERGAVVAMIGPRAVGLAQWARYAGERHVADVAVAVGDRYQKRGLGAALVAAGTVAAARSGVTHVAATVHPDSRTVLGWLQGAGAVSRPGHAGELLVEATALVDHLEVQRAERLGLSASSRATAPAGPLAQQDPSVRALHRVVRRVVERRPVPAAVVGDVAAGRPDRDRRRAAAGQPVDAGAVAAEVAAVGPRPSAVVRVRRHVHTVVRDQEVTADGQAAAGACGRPARTPRPRRPRGWSSRRRSRCGRGRAEWKTRDARSARGEPDVTSTRR